MSRVTSWSIHCQICEKQISAVETSSSWFSNATCPLPPSHSFMYPTATRMFIRTPCSVTIGSRPVMSRMFSLVTCTSGRLFSSWWGRDPSAASKTASAAGTRAGSATQVPSKPCPASRALPSRMRSATVAGGDEAIGEGLHQRQIHRQALPVGQNVVAGVAQVLDHGEQVVPAGGFESGAVLAQLEEDLLHLEHRGDGLDVRGGP